MKKVNKKKSSLAKKSVANEKQLLLVLMMISVICIGLFLVKKYTDDNYFFNVPRTDYSQGK